MKRFLSTLGIVILILVIVALTVFLILKIRSDTIAQKDNDILIQNEQAESDYICQRANDNLKEIIAKIEKDVGKEVELADIGSISKIDLCFVAEVDGEYKYIVKEDDDGNEKFAIADDNSQAARYIVSLKAIELDSCVYTKIDNYIIDEDFNITYLMTTQDEI